MGMRARALVFLLSPAWLHAQHCAYDLAIILVVHPHRLNSALVEPGPRITVFDSNNLPALINGQEWNRFRPNDGRSVLPDRTWQPHFDRYKGHELPFAGDNPVLVAPAHLSYAGSSIPAQDERNGGTGELRRTVVPITSNDVHPLCGRYNEAVHPPLEGRPNFAPVEVILNTR